MAVPSWITKAWGWAVSPLKKPGKRLWWDSLMWFLFNILGGLLPLYGGALILRAFSQPYTPRDFIRHGEFVLYAASFLAPALGLILRDFKTSTFFGRPVFGFLVAIGWGATAILFACVQAAATVQPGQASVLRLNEDFLVHSSVTLFIASIPLAFFVTLLDGVRTQLDFKAQFTQGPKKLEEDFDKLKE